MLWKAGWKASTVISSTEQGSICISLSVGVTVCWSYVFILFYSFASLVLIYWLVFFMEIGMGKKVFHLAARLILAVLIAHLALKAEREPLKEVMSLPRGGEAPREAVVMKAKPLDVVELRLVYVSD